VYEVRSLAVTEGQTRAVIDRIKKGAGVTEDLVSSAISVLYVVRMFSDILDFVPIGVVMTVTEYVQFLANYQIKYRSPHLKSE